MDHPSSPPLTVATPEETTRRIASAQLQWLKAIVAAAATTWQNHQSK